MYSYFILQQKRGLTTDVNSVKRDKHLFMHTFSYYRSRDSTV